MSARLPGSTAGAAAVGGVGSGAGAVSAGGGGVAAGAGCVGAGSVTRCGKDGGLGRRSPRSTGMASSASATRISGIIQLRFGASSSLIAGPVTIRSS